MGQVTVRVDDKDLNEMDRIMKSEGLETRSELIRKAWKVYKRFKDQEAQGRVIVSMPPDAIKDSPVQLTI